MTFKSKYLNHITGDSENHLRNTDCFVFPSGTDREEIIDTLEAYCAVKKFNRVRTYETIGAVLNDNCFTEKWIERCQRFFNVATDAIEVQF
ncbi:MAG: hypothetical protein ACKPCM_18790 [Pseudanabaena sp.]